MYVYTRYYIYQKYACSKPIYHALFKDFSQDRISLKDIIIPALVPPSPWAVDQYKISIASQVHNIKILFYFFCDNLFLTFSLYAADNVI